MIDNATVDVVMNIFQTGIDASLTPPISYGIVLGIVLIGIKVVSKWFKPRK